VACIVNISRNTGRPSCVSDRVAWQKFQFVIFKHFEMSGCLISAQKMRQQSHYAAFAGAVKAGLETGLSIQQARGCGVVKLCK